MKSVNTTLGALPVDRLGRVNVHEHIILDTTGKPHIPESFHHTDVDLVADELTAWRIAGGGALIDCSPLGAGRNIELLKAVSLAANVPIIATSGFHKGDYYPEGHWVHVKSEPHISEIVADECIKGILVDDEDPEHSARSEVKAGALKMGVGPDGLTPLITKIIRAVGKVVNDIDMRCLIHTEPGVPFTEVVALLESIQVPPEKVIFCHMGKSLDPILHTLLASSGYYLEFDEMVRPEPTRAELASAILSLFEQGFGHKVLFAGDYARRSYWTCYGGTPGLPYLVSGLSGELIEAGFSRGMLDQIWIDNPRNYFSGSTKDRLIDSICKKCIR